MTRAAGQVVEPVAGPEVVDVEEPHDRADCVHPNLRLVEVTVDGVGGGSPWHVRQARDEVAESLRQAGQQVRERSSMLRCRREEVGSGPAGVPAVGDVEVDGHLRDPVDE